MDKKVTIIIPVYNAGKNIDHCIKSILNQTSKDFKVLLINDGSTDDSLQRIINYRRGTEHNRKGSKRMWFLGPGF